MTPTPAAPAAAAPAAVTPPAAAAAPAVSAADHAALLQKVADLEKANTESQRTAQFWYDRAPKGTPAPAAAAPAADEDPDVLDVITSKGAKGLDEILKKRGYVRKEEMESTVNAKADQVVREADLVRDYPDLKDKKSEFFQQTAHEYGLLTQSGVPANMAMGLAAERVALRHTREGKMKTPAQVADETKATKEADRLARIAAQGGGGGSRGSATDESDELTPEQERIAVQMLKGEPGKDGKAMTAEQAIEAYKARAKGGVTLRGLR